MNGFGTYTFADGSHYEGDWVEGKRCGQGVKKFTNGDIYLFWLGKFLYFCSAIFFLYHTRFQTFVLFL